MQRHLTLVESDFEKLEKRILPRFPFCYLTFKCSQDIKHVFEVKDISNSGMQLALKNGEHGLKVEDQIHGRLHWTGTELEITGDVKWEKDFRLGIEFSTQASLREDVDQFLDLGEIAKKMKPVHQVSHGTNLPSNLECWMRADGPVELFIWVHGDGEMAKFQILIMENFIEWENGIGLKTARVISKRDIDTPLITEDEFVFKFDDNIDDLKIEKSRKIVSNLDKQYLPKESYRFIKMKLGI